MSKALTALACAFAIAAAMEPPAQVRFDPYVYGTQRLMLPSAEARKLRPKARLVWCAKHCRRT